jgi:phytoene/squalene synthetase
MSSDNSKTMSSIDHYENFPVASVLCPPRLRAPIVAIYHFARTADDLADEGDAPAAERLQDLHSLREDLLKQLTDETFHSMRWAQVLAPLVKQIRQFDLPTPLLLALLDAFEQDVVYTRDQRRYADRAELLAYCNRSANPIGRLLLHMYGISSPQALTQSDAVCSALQLINFWQDLSIDIPRGRFYLPADSRLQDELVFARQLMLRGAALVHQVPGRAGWELRLVVQGGLRVLDKVERMDTSQHRPRLHVSDMAVIAWRSLWMRQPVSTSVV